MVSIGGKEFGKNVVIKNEQMKEDFEKIKNALDTTNNQTGVDSILVINENNISGSSSYLGFQIKNYTDLRIEVGSYILKEYLSNNDIYSKFSMVNIAGTLTHLYSEKGPFGINTIIEVNLSREMTLTLSKTFPNISSEVIPYEFPKKCPYCNQELELKTGKTDSTLKCLNKSCKGILMKRLEKFLSELGLKGISEKTIFNYFENRPFNFRDFYRDVINVPMKSTTRRTGKTTIDKGPKYNFDELMTNATNEQLLIAFQIATQSTLKATMERYGLSWNHKDIAALRRIDDELIKEVL